MVFYVIFGNCVENDMNVTGKCGLNDRHCKNKEKRKGF